MNRFIFILMLAFIVCGCRSTKVVEVDVPRIEKEYIVSTDTVHQYDSVWVYNDRYVNYDTIYITKTSEKYKYLYKIRVDTLVRCDTITVIDTEQIKALSSENDALRATMNFYRYLGMSLLVIIGMMGLYLLFKR